ncbi:MAG: hypothetical protein M1820_009675 [Bogoriella megaspora]|nr:MAG: hypothetical protein M1820_009675 [Bogoriella megaspora]
MPPRKKAKVSSASSPRNSQPKTPLDPTETGDKGTPQAADDISDPWTDEQETELFRSIIQWKPTGIHKHFRMLSISNSLVSHGISRAKAPHTRIPGIWEKLRTMYDLATMDEREYVHAGYSESNVFADSPQLDEESDEDVPREFTLPWEDYGDMMWQRRFASSPSTSEPEVPDIAVGKEDQPPARLSPSVVIDIEKSRTAKASAKPAPARSTKTRPAAGRTRTASGVRSGRGAKRETPQEEPEEESDEDGDEEEEEEEEEDTESVPVKRGRGAAKAQKGATKETARRSTRKR